MIKNNSDKHDINLCYICGAEVNRKGNSLHCWDIEYKCGCKIYGAFDNEKIYKEGGCSNESN